MILVVPGVTGDFESPYVVDLVEQATKQGYSLVVVNTTVPKSTNEDNLEVIDFAQT